MKTYLVGGAVRDKLLGRDVHEYDWVVVGSSAEQMIKRGYKPVGKDFPVFLHPNTKEEYALARTERKISQGYKGFEFYASPDVTLEQDLARRDLTVNAIAQDTKGRLIDPFGGQIDIQKKILRHVSNAFAEDPVRVLRLARFHARFPEFSIHPDTLTLTKTMVNNGEVNALVAERVWAECFKALQEPCPVRFFELLKQIHALEIAFPYLQLVTQNHQALIRASQLTKDPEVRFASVCHLLKPEQVTPLTSHIKCPKTFHELIKLTIQCLPKYKQYDYTPTATLDILKHCDALRRPERFEQFLLTAHACYDTTDHHDGLRLALSTIRELDISPLIKRGLKGRHLAEAIQQTRLEVLKNL